MRKVCKFIVFSLKWLKVMWYGRARALVNQLLAGILLVQTMEQ